MTGSKYGLLTKPILFDFLHKELITIVQLSTIVIAIYKFSSSINWLPYALIPNDLYIHNVR